MHESVLLTESINYLNLNTKSIVVDCTLGYAGHSSQILKQIPNGFLYAFDQDKEAIIQADKKLKAIRDNYEIINTNFVNLKEEIKKRTDNVDGILFDLGVSSPQLDEDYRGFSFHKDAFLDMRMNQDQKLRAYDVVNDYSKEDLIRIFKEYGEEKYASSIAEGIDANWISQSQKEEMATTGALLNLTGLGVTAIEIPQTFVRGTYDFKVDNKSIYILPDMERPIKLFFEGDTRARDLDESMTHDQTIDSQVQTKLGHAVVISNLFGKYTIE